MDNEYGSFAGSEYSLLREQFEFRENDDGTVSIKGYAAKFNNLSHPFGNNFYETIQPGAFRNALSSSKPIDLLIMHDGLPVASTKSGSLNLTEDNIGLRMNATLDASDPDVQRIVPKIKRGDLSEMSFGFRSKETKYTTKVVDGKNVRTLQDVGLFEVSMVNRGQYPNTELKMRSLQADFGPDLSNELDELGQILKDIQALKDSNKDTHEERFKDKTIYIP